MDPWIHGRPLRMPKSGVKWISIPDFTAVSVFLHDHSCSLLLISLTHAHLHAHTFASLGAGSTRTRAHPAWPPAPP